MDKFKGFYVMADMGPKFTYKPEMLPQILEGVERVKGSLGQVADLNRIPRKTFYHWINRGDEHSDDGITSKLAHLSRSVREKQAEVIEKLVSSALGESKASKFIQWWLSVICREDFGREGIEMRQLKDLFEVLAPMMTGKGAIDHGRQKELDQGSDQT